MKNTNLLSQSSSRNRLEMGEGRNWVTTEDVRGGAVPGLFMHVPHLPEGYKTKLPRGGIHSHHFVTNMGPAHSTSFLGEGNLPIILSQAGACCNRSAHLPQVQHKHTHWLGGTKDFAEETTGDENSNWIVVSRGSHCCLRGVWLPPPFDYYTHLL